MMDRMRSAGSVQIPARTEPNRAALTARHLRILQALAASSAPLTTSTLRRQACLFVGEARQACSWLKDHHYISCLLKRVQQSMGHGRVYRRVAFWSLTDKGRAHLSSDDGPPSGLVSGTNGASLSPSPPRRRGASSGKDSFALDSRLRGNDEGDRGNDERDDIA